MQTNAQRQPEITQYHLSALVAEVARMSDATLCALFHCEESDLPELRTRIAIAQARGHVHMPLKACDNFDPAIGCRGHAHITLEPARGQSP